MVVILVVGPPCGGKTTYVQRHRAREDVVIDADLIAEALGSRDSHNHPAHIKALAAKIRDYATQQVSQKAYTTWIVSASPTAEANIPHTDVVVIDPGMQVCLTRAANRPRWTTQAIQKYYESRDPDITAKRSNSRKWLEKGVRTCLRLANTIGTGSTRPKGSASDSPQTSFAPTSGKYARQMALRLSCLTKSLNSSARRAPTRKDYRHAR